MKPRIMVVDDESCVREITSAYLSELGDIVEHSNPVNAIEEIRSNPPDLVVTDQNMPGMKGEELLRAFSIPGIIVTGDESDFNRLSSLFSVLKKPFRSEELLKIVKEKLDDGKKR